jgi:cytochrome c oxidase subunit II
MLVLVMFGWGAAVFFRGSRVPDDAVRFEVVGKQWMWKFQHPSGHREINDLHVPIGVRVELHMTSEDVIHSLFVPAFRVKQDVLPGRYTRMWFEATRPGAYHIFCAEYCGTKHSHMIGTLHALEPLDYELWLAGAPTPEDPVEAGALLFQSLRCDTCHAPGAEERGPRLEGAFGREVLLTTGETVLFDEEYVRRSILDPGAQIVAGYQPLMPTYRGQVTPEQISQLIAYIRSLSDTEPPAEEGSEQDGAREIENDQDSEDRR